jgi:hypothetical protein
MYINLNTNEFGCTLYGITNCLLSNYTTTYMKALLFLTSILYITIGF